MSPIRNANGIETANQTSLHLLKHSFHVGNCKGPSCHLLVQPDVTHNVQNADTCRPRFISRNILVREQTSVPTFNQFV